MFSGSDRFVVEERLGAGGMGVVYRVFDRVRRASVALKVLRNVSPSAILRFKSEFRALSGVSHRNLVTMYELLSDADQWFFTMELVDGVDFLEYVRGPEAAVVDASSSRTAETAPLSSAVSTDPRTAQTVDLGSTSSSDTSRNRGAKRYAPATSPEQIARLRDAAGQLAAGVAALHRGGRLHRDLKPSNVLVTREGRLVILDFGLVAALASDPQLSDDRNLVLGTPQYMAPEQAVARAATEASDWYAVGTMLYHALTGRLPFDGSKDYVLGCKRARIHAPPVSLDVDAPADLASLCDRMLAVAPSARPGEGEVLEQLRVRPEADARPAVESVGGAGALHGRDRHLEVLNDAYRVASWGKAQVVFVHGRSGMGKTALVSRFLEQLRATDGTVVLEGRCHECESVPYKAIDNLVDSLVRYLLTLPDDVAEDVLPSDVRLLARLFPVLRRVPAVAGAPPGGIESLGPLELRRRGFEAFRALIGEVAALGRTVLFIDDVQWGEMDSAQLLEHLMRGPGAPPVLLVLAYRREDADTSAPLVSLRAAWPEAVTLPVDPLSADESTQLARAILGEGAGIGDAAEAIAREAQGSPLFVHELAGNTARPRGADASAQLSPGATLDEVLRGRLRRLPAHARRLLEVVAVAGRPTPQHLAARAAELERDEQAAIAVLRNGKWARTRGVRVDDDIECFHDRIRETVVAQLAADELRGHHARLGRTLREAGGVDPEILSVHYENAGDLDQAASLSAAAADTAAQAVAFDRAAALYRRALELRPPADAETEIPLRRRLADALANARRGTEAAHEYRRAAELADEREDALSLRRRAAEELLRSGHVDAGMELLGEVLAAEGMRLPATPRSALVSLLARRARVRLRGLRFRHRDADEVEPAKRRRIDLCWSVASGLAMVDNIRGADFQARSLLLALGSGDVFQVARALAAEAGFAAVAGGPGRRRAARLQARADELARSLGDPYLIGFSTGVAGIAAFLRGDWSEGKALVAEAERILHEECAGAGWELDMARLYYCWCLVFRGEFAEASQTIPRFVRESEDRGDIYAAANLRTTLSNLVWLAADDVDEARANADSAMLQWSQQGFFMQHFYDLLARGNIDLYAGTGLQAFERITAAWPALSKAMILRVQYCRITLRDMRARGAIAGALRAERSSGRERLLREAERDARRLERERMAWSDPLAQLIRAGVAAAQDRPNRALEHLELAVGGFDERDMALHAAVARRRAGELRGGERGTALVQECDAWMREQRIARPARMADMLAPGFR